MLTAPAGSRGLAATAPFFTAADFFTTLATFCALTALAAFTTVLADLAPFAGAPPVSAPVIRLSAFERPDPMADTPPRPALPTRLNDAPIPLHRRRPARVHIGPAALSPDAPRRMPALPTLPARFTP